MERMYCTSGDMTRLSNLDIHDMIGVCCSQVVLGDDSSFIVVVYISNEQIVVLSLVHPCVLLNINGSRQMRPTLASIDDDNCHPSVNSLC